MTSARLPSVVVLVSAGRHPVSGAARACPGDVAAMAQAFKLGGPQTRVVYAGSSDDACLQDYLALGAARIDVLSVESRHDPLPALCDFVKRADVVVTGLRTENGVGSGLLPYALAQALGRPIVAQIIGAQTSDATLRLRQFLPKGRRRMIEAKMPVVITVHPLAPSDLKYAHARRISGRIDAIEPVRDVAAQAPLWTVDAHPRRPVPLTAAKDENGHARMLALIETKARGGTVAFEGTSVDKAQILFSYLRNNRLIDV
jgi:electron transfer flavoprotein beta subunit